MAGAFLSPWGAARGTDSGMERVFGGTEACEFTKQINFEPSDVAFDDALKTD